MRNFGRLSDRNLATNGALTGGQWVLPLENLLDPKMLAKPARCTDIANLASSQFTIKLARPRTLDLVSLLFHTMSRTAKYRVTLKNAAGVVINIPEWLDVYPRLYPSAVLEWEDENYWDGRTSAADLNLYPRSLWIPLEPALIVEEIHIEIDDSQNPAGEIDIGYLWVAATWSPAFNFERGRTLALTQQNRADESLSGHPVGEYRRPQRVMTVNWADLEKHEVLRFTDIGARVGTTRPVLFIPDIYDQVDMFRESFLATLETPPTARFQFQGRHSSELVLKEIMR